MLEAHVVADSEPTARARANVGVVDKEEAARLGSSSAPYMG